MGCLPTGYMFGKAAGVDLTRQGSGSTGFTNIFRIAGVRWAFAALFTDFLKGAGVAYIGKQFFTSDLFILSLILTVALGNIFSVFLKFRGGKGVAVISGGIAVLAWNPILILLVVSFWAFILLWKRIMSLANLAVFLFAVPVYLLVFYESWIWYGAGFGIFIFLLFTHRGNVGRLIRGEEKKFIFKNTKTR